MPILRKRLTLTIVLFVAALGLGACQVTPLEPANPYKRGPVSEP